jgi:hypothetical protein
VAPALKSASLRCPIHEAFHMVTVFPSKMKELAGSQIGALFAEEGFKPPPQVGAFPWIEAIAPGRIPVIVKRLEHLLRNGRDSPSPRRQDSSFPRAAQKDAHERAPSLRRASPKSPYNEDPGP